MTKAGLLFFSTILLFLLGGCSSASLEQENSNKSKLENSLAKRALGNNNPEYLREYLRRYPKGKYKSEIQNTYTKLRVDSLEAALKSWDPDILRSHAKEYPEDWNAVRGALNRDVNAEVMSRFRKAKTVHIDYQYTEQGEAVELPDPFPQKIQNLIKSKDLIIVDESRAEVRIIISGDTQIKDVKYSLNPCRRTQIYIPGRDQCTRTIRGAIVRFTGQISFDTREGPKKNYDLYGALKYAPSTLLASQLPFSWMKPKFTPYDALNDSELMDVLKKFITSTYDN